MVHMRKDADSIMEHILQSAHESEIIEFKDRKTLGRDDIGRYFSALSNEARLNDSESAWLIFGISDSGEIHNSDYLSSVESRNDITHYVSEQTSNGLSFTGLYEYFVDGMRVLLMEVPASRIGVPTAFKGIAYERQGDSVCALTDSKRMRLMYASIPDWSAEIIKGVSVDDVLDPEAILIARKYFVKLRPERRSDCESWSDEVFLNKIGLTNKGVVTHAAMVLLGKSDCSYLVPDSVLAMRWILRDQERTTLDNQMFNIPFIKAVDELCGRIRNLSYEYYKGGSLIPFRMDTYDTSILREILYNCIAHQDYRKREFITVVEYDRDRLVFKNAGYFIPGTLENVLSSDSLSSYYRNAVLAQAMKNLGMVDVAGGGIIRIFKSQIARFFPLPEYDLSDDHVQVTLHGKVINQGFKNLLLHTPGLPFEDILSLDAIQKGKRISDEVSARLVTKGLIEFNGTDYEILSSVFGNQTDGVSERQEESEEVPQEGSENQAGFKNSDYRELVMDLLRQRGPMNKKEIVEALSDAFPEDYDEKRRIIKVQNLISDLKKDGRIVTIGRTRNACYSLDSVR